MALRKSLDVRSEEANTPYDVRVQQQIAAQEAGMFSGSNKWLLIGGLAVAAYLAFGPQPTKSKPKSIGSGSGLNGPKKRKKRKGKK